MNPVRVRFAPSPTGHLHIGGLRTSLYNWLFARHNRGSFLIRIEDTDLERSKPEHTESIMQSLKWASMEPDEPVAIQTARKEEHLKVAHELLEKGKAYRCYCSQDELKQRLGDSAALEGSYTRYDNKCRQFIGKGDKNGPSAIRFKLPDDQAEITFTDLIRGPVTFDKDQLDDFIIVRSDGNPMYNFVVVVDDAWMKITHVLRGEDHIPNTPKQILLYKACDYSVPQFAHFSLILGPDGKRLSKRHGTTSVLDFKERGFLADALCNFLVRLGWSHGDQELFSREEMINHFTLEHMHKSQAVFDIKKLEWINSMYIRALSADEIVKLIERDVCLQFVTSLANWSTPTISAMVSLYKERVKTLRELVDELQTVHNRPQAYLLQKDSNEKQICEALEYLGAFEESLLKLDTVSHETVDHLIKELCSKNNIGMAQIAQPLRIALTGKSSSPGVAQLIALLGADETAARISKFREYLKKRSSEAESNI